MLPVITWSLTAKPKQELRSVKFQVKVKISSKKQPKSHISETPKRYQKLRRKYMTRITSSKDIMIQVREICYQTKKLVLIRNKLNFELRS